MSESLSELLPAANSITAYPRREELLIIGDWETPAAIGQPVLDMADSLAATLELALMAKEIRTQQAADQLTKTLALVGRWTQDLSDLAEAYRRPYLEKHRSIKAAADSVLTPLMILTGKASNLLANFEAEKVLARERIEDQNRREAAQRAREESEKIAAAEAKRQADEKAEADRIAELQAKAAQATTKKTREAARANLEEEKRKADEAAAQRLADQEAEQRRFQAVSTPAPVHYTPEKTEGTRVATAYEFDVADEKAFAQWIWATGKDGWIRRIEFDKRTVKGWIDAQKSPGPTAVPIVPGLNIRRCLGVSVNKAPRAKAPLTVSTQRVDLDRTEEQQLGAEPAVSTGLEWFETPHSSQIQRFGYDAGLKLLKVNFKTGSVYDYMQVPAEVFNAFKGAESAGIYFGKHIKGVYGYQRQS